MTRTITFIALICCLLGGAAIISILGRDSVPMATAEMIPAKAIAPVANRDSKHDKLAVALPPTTAEPAQAVSLSEPLRQAYASSNPTDTEAENAVAAAMPAVTGAVPPAKPKLASKPQPQRPYALLSDAQIAGIKERLHLTSDQEYYWPGIESALRAVARKIRTARQTNPNANASAIDPDSQEVQQLKSAAMPLLFQLRDDQKEEVRRLARIIGLDKVAAAI
ncbi:hypothetical protein [Bradyrhizobium sp.]|uniref:hypothetical protein n=1 Tax=Bradyrhizobium sp. TaxID=376 RepID=UPI0025C4779F|nr:hypothetical protein [Bradyrhizobium sp.]MBV8920664.1 hypothetical protein [Bradyrhizobium sp.]